MLLLQLNEAVMLLIQEVKGFLDGFNWRGYETDLF